MFTLIGFCTIVAGLVVFTCFNITLRHFQWIPLPSGYDTVNKQHNWRNTIGSLVHATIMWIMSYMSLPALWEDFVGNYTQLGEITLGITIGYAIYDILDLFTNKPLRVIWPLLIHHFIAVFFPSLFLWRQEYLAYGIICCTVEVNSIALHIRQLLLMYNVTKQSIIFKANNVFNLFHERWENPLQELVCNDILGFPYRVNKGRTSYGLGIPLECEMTSYWNPPGSVVV
ncbi:TLC domain-containing protein 2-like [Amphiura filiformis]|uniref:TLC domain-containing protein 2-like n=1 Tax=Amphiura filiformis TaxID=82378 RepID=UPI003B21DFB7